MGCPVCQISPHLLCAHPPSSLWVKIEFNEWREERKKNTCKKPSQTNKNSKTNNNKTTQSTMKAQPTTMSIRQLYNWCKGNHLPPAISWSMPSHSLSNNYHEKTLPTPVFPAEHDFIGHGMFLVHWMACLLPSPWPAQHISRDRGRCGGRAGAVRALWATAGSSVCYQHCLGHTDSTQHHVGCHEEL